MKGTITIKSDNKSGFSIEMQMSRVSRMDELLIFDALANAFELGEEDRFVFGSIIAAGGVKEVFGDAPDMIKMDVGLINKLRRESE